MTWSITRLRTLLVALFVFTAGCNAVPGVGDQSDSAPDSGPAVQHVGYLSSSSHGYNATVTIRQGETVVSRQTLSFEDDAIRYVSLTTLNETGTYTIEVATDIPGVGGGTMTETSQIEVDPGPEQTVIHTSYTDIAFVTGTDADRSVDVPVRYTWSHPHDGRLAIQVSSEQTEVVSSTRHPIAFAEPRQTADTLETSGVYWVLVRTNQSADPGVAVGVVNESTEMVLVRVDPDGDIAIDFPQTEGDESEDEWE